MTLEELLASDSIRPHDAPPHGVPSYYDWAQGPVCQNPTPEGFEFFNPWGQVYIPADASTYPNNGRVEIRELQAWLLKRSTLAWEPAYSSVPKLTVSARTELNAPAEDGTAVSINTDRPGSILSYPPQGKILHFYPAVARVEIDPLDVAGVAVTCRMRMTLLTTQPYPRWIANVGADWWPAATGSGVKGVGQGRFKTVDANQWRVYGFTSCPGVPLMETSDAEWY